MNKLSRLTAFILLFLLTNSIHAQSMEESFHANGKIRLVVSIAAIVMIGLLVFIFMLERRVSKLEKEKKQQS